MGDAFAEDDLLHLRTGLLEDGLVQPSLHGSGTLVFLIDKQFS